MDNPFELHDWDELEDWQPQTIARLRARVIRELSEGRYGKDFEAKLAERGISMEDILNVLRGKRTYIVKYRDRHTRRWRIGFWHPRIELFVAWKPGRNGGLKTCFWRKSGVKYIQERLLCSKPVYRPKKAKRWIRV